MKLMKTSFTIITMFFFAPLFAQNTTETFVVAPYLQIGKNPSATTLNVEWQTKNEEAAWKVETSADKKKWVSKNNPSFVTLAVKGIDTRMMYSCVIENLSPGSSFSYRILKNKKVVFSSEAKSLKANNQAYRFVAFGDIACGSPESKLIAEQVYRTNPDLVVVSGDIVYGRGLVSEYDQNFWSVYNADVASSQGAPLIRKIPFVAAPGNHDTEEIDLNAYPDAQAYFYFWNQPLNGPVQKEGSTGFPDLKMSDEARTAFVAAAGNRFPTMANFSFDYGNSHWTVLDANPYVDWTDKALTDWVANDLEKAAGATWRFVLFHHPGFNSSRAHYEQQQMRLLAPIFEKGKADVVFNGHVHNYQVTYPMTFAPDGKGVVIVGGKDGKNIRGRLVNGAWKLDKTFNGNTITKANGVVYIITGAGGKDLYNPEQTNDPDSWQKFTNKFLATIHSFSVIDVDGNKFSLKQIDKNGKEIDSFTITK